MDTVAFTMLLFVTVSAAVHFGKYVYIENSTQWRVARKFCRDHFTDLSPITSSSVEEHLKNMTAGIITDTFWTGLNWNNTHWRWSGGITDDIPPTIEGTSHKGQRFASLTLGPDVNEWKAENPDKELPFLCINLVIMERTSWEGALESCRQNQTSLTSMTSGVELLMAKTKIKKGHFTDRLWVGLRFLTNRWMWMYTDPLMYQDLPKAFQDHQCPAEGRCGALNKLGQWEIWDCEEKLNFICS